MSVKFSVLMSVYKNDKPSFFNLALESIYEGQTLKPNQIVIVKDGPLSLELNQIIDSFKKNTPNVKLVSLSTNKGLGEALRIGLRECIFEFVVRMDSDDISTPDRFKTQINYLFQNPNIDILSSWVDEFSGSVNNIVSTRKLPLTHSGCAKMLKYGCPINHPAVVFKKSKVLSVGSYESFYLKEDVYLWLKLYVNNAKFANIPESLLLFRVNDNMYKRRRGVKYAKSEFKLFIFRYKNQVINFFELMKFGVLISFIRLLPIFLVKKIYKILRKY